MVAAALAAAVMRVLPKLVEVELNHEGKGQSSKPNKISPIGKGLALPSSTEIEVLAGDRLIWTTNNRELGLASRSLAGVLKIDLEDITMKDDHTTGTLVSDNPRAKAPPTASCSTCTAPRIPCPPSRVAGNRLGNPKSALINTF